MPDITEFTEIDVDELHFVARGANGFPPLLAKADSGEVTKADCPTCHGSGKIRDGHVTCPDCDGSGQAEPDEPADAEKGELSAHERNKLDGSDFAFVDDNGDGHLPINDEAHVRAALGRFGQTEFPSAATKKEAAEKVLAAAKKYGINVSDDTDVVDAAKAAGAVSGANPMFGTPVVPDAAVPGSPAWEATDADTAAEAAQQLMAAADLIRTFAGREAAEYAAGEGNDLFDTWDAEQALDLVTCALGIMARLAFIEANGATKGAEGASKAGKVLSSKSIDAIRAAIKALEDLLASAAGGSNKGGDAATATKETLNVEITPEALAEMVAGAATDAVAAVKAAGKKAAKEAKKSKQAAKAEKKAAKAARRAAETPEETEAREAAKAAKREARKAAKAEKEAAKAEKTATAVVEKVEGAIKGITEQVESLSVDLEKVKKTAAPGGPVKTRTQDQINKSTERDQLELMISDLERRADLTTDLELRKGYLERAKAARAQLANVA